jgi:hypothetical protein
VNNNHFYSLSLEALLKISGRHKIFPLRKIINENLKFLSLMCGYFIIKCFSTKVYKFPVVAGVSQIFPYIFGFSSQAFSAKILTSLLVHKSPSHTYPIMGRETYEGGGRSHFLVGKYHFFRALENCASRKYINNRPKIDLLGQISFNGLTFVRL